MDKEMLKIIKRQREIYNALCPILTEQINKRREKMSAVYERVIFVKTGYIND
jgi:hypothetical protein